MNFKKIIFGFCIFASGISMAQSPRVSDFKINSIDNNKVLVRWVISAGSTCQEVKVERSADNLNFKTVYSYPGICGGTSEEEPYTWIDGEAILNKLSYYRIRVAVDEYSLVDSIKIDKPTQGELIYVSPNPSSAIFKISLSKSEGKSYDYQLYSADGKLKQSRKNQSATVFQLKLGGYNSGVYLLKVQLKNGEVDEVYLNLVK